MDGSSQNELEFRIKLLESQVHQLSEINPQSHNNKLRRSGLGIYIPVWVALITLICSIIAYSINTMKEYRLTETKFKSELVVNSLKTVDKKEAADRLKFLVSAGLIEDDDGKIMGLAGKPLELPILSEAYVLRSRRQVLLLDNLERYYVNNGNSSTDKGTDRKRSNATDIYEKMHDKIEASFARLIITEQWSEHNVNLVKDLKPDLIVIHFSGFHHNVEDKGKKQAVESKFKPFITTMLEHSPNTKFLIYSRTPIKLLKGNLKNWADINADDKRVFAYSVDGNFLQDTIIKDLQATIEKALR